MLIGSAVSAGAAPLINEFLASNVSVSPDNSDFDDYSDWIELYNPDSTTVSLSNHFLTDDLTQPFKWMIPAGAEIPANGYLMVRADGFDAGPGETHVRGYWPWGSTFQTRRYHTSFKLSAGGEEIGLYRSDTPPIESTLIATNALWRYLDAGTNPGVDWMTPGFDDTGWASGVAELGYGDGDEVTTVSYGPNASAKYPTTHFRHQFSVTDPTRIGNIRFRVLVDDGAIFYLNGIEAVRLRMPEGQVSYQDYTGLSGDDYAFEWIELSPAQLRAGDNILAVEVHQASGNSSDLSFNAELHITEFSGTPILVDSVSFGAQTADIAYGRDPASTNGWSFFGEPTPDGTNVTEALSQFSFSPVVSASLNSGFYTNGQTLTLSSPGATSIRYTLDGSVPSSTSPAYSNALTITETTIVRARSFTTGLIPGPTLTRSFFLDADANPALPVLSFVTDPDALFDSGIGIYENDTDYVYKGREIPICLEMFEADQTPAFAINAGARIAGENIWDKPQKPFNVYCRSKYGDDVINYQIFPNEPVAEFGELNLRNGGDDWEGTLLRDAMMPSILEGQVRASLYSYRPGILFLNGQFWGIYNLRKRFDSVFFGNEHYLTEGDYDQLAYAHNEAGVTTLMAESGDTEDYEAFKAYFTTNDVSDPLIYSGISEQMDVDSFIDYVVATDFPVNTSWSHNREFWRSRADGSRWQWVINDFDRAFDPAKLNLSPSSSLYSSPPIASFSYNYPLFQALVDNTNFVNRLVQRYAAHVGSTFHPGRIQDQLDVLSAEQDAVMARHIARWQSEGGISSLTARQAQLNEIKQFAVNRPAYAISRLQSEFGLSHGPVDLSVEVFPANSGRILIAGVPMIPEYNQVVGLFAHIPVELSAEAAPGYAFTGWSNGSTNRTIEITLAAAAMITANFEAGAETILADTISVDTTLGATGSPYTVTNNLVVEAGATLTIDPGVEVLMPARNSIDVHGRLQVNGTPSNPVSITGRSGQAWGSLNFVNASGHSILSHLILRDATRSLKDPLNLKATVSGYNSAITLDHVDIETPAPVFTRFGSTTVLNSRIHILFTGDGINVKSGAGRVENSTFIGNEAPDTDAIDFDDVMNGTIAGNRIYAFRGGNSDAIDVGEGCQNLNVVSNRIFNITDKGVSVGQASSAFIYRNLIVDCDMGVGVKDTGSIATVDQNTFAANNIGVAAFEKNKGNGGGIATVSNCIFSRSKDFPVSADTLSGLAVNYSLSDTLALTGNGNVQEDPLFTDPGSYDFSLTESSPARDSGNPAYPLDADGSRADMGAYYVYDPADYPYLIPNVVVVNEVLAHSHDIDPDWIELLNTSSQDLDMSGWYLSDDPDTPLKYRIADGTVLPANGYLVFYEDLDFGLASTNSGAEIPFALSENGDTVNVFGPTDGLRPDYTEKEVFGGSLRDVTKGRYYKESTRTYNFVTLLSATPGSANSDPHVGPVVISEIMYHPPNSAAEYIELVNITAGPVTLYDYDVNEPWRMTKGIDYIFPAQAPVTLQSGERMLLVKDPAAFALEYTVPSGIQVFQWDTGSLNNGGETLELSMPGDVDDLDIRQFIRVDRVDYSDSEPWPVGPDGGGSSLARRNERAYGNDVANWTESEPTAGQTGYQKWAAAQNFPAGEDGPDGNPDEDTFSNKEEYALGLNPMDPFSSPVWEMAVDVHGTDMAFVVPSGRSDVEYTIQARSDLVSGDWTNLSGTMSSGAFRAWETDAAEQRYYRLVILLLNQY